MKLREFINIPESILDLNISF